MLQLGFGYGERENTSIFIFPPSHALDKKSTTTNAVFFTDQAVLNKQVKEVAVSCSIRALEVLRTAWNE